MMNEQARQAIIDFISDKENIDVAGNSLLIFKDDKEIFRHYNGYAKKDNIFRIYSMTKVFTVVSALQLYEQGKFSLDDYVSQYIPEYENLTVWDENTKSAKPAKNKLTIKNLFCMTSGIPYGGDWGGEAARQQKEIHDRMLEKYPGDTYTTLAYVKEVAKGVLAFEPGCGWLYGLSHDILGACIEVWSGQTLGEYMKEHIFKPLGLQDTFFRCPADKRDRLAPHDGSAEDEAKFMETAKYEAGGGGLLSTLDDYMKFANTLTRGGISTDGVRILKQETIDLMRQDQLTDVQKPFFNWDYLHGYSYGLGVRTNVDIEASGVPGSVGEFGWCGVLGTWTLMDPSENLTVVYMHQRYPNLEKYVQLGLRPLIYNAIR